MTWLRCRIFFVSLCLPGLIVLGSLPARTAPGTKAPRAATPGIPYVGLSVAAGTGITRLASNAAVFPFGVRSLPEPGSVQAVFTLTNEAHKPLTLARLQPTCRCTRAEVLPPADGMPTLPPGGRLRVRVTVDLADHAPGALVKSVYVFASNHSKPAARLDIAGTLMPPSAP